MPFFHINPQIFAVKEKQYTIFSIFLQISIEKTFKKIMVLSNGIIYMIILSYFLNIIIRKHTWFSF